MKFNHNQLLAKDFLQIAGNIINSKFQMNDPKKPFYLALIKSYESDISSPQTDKPENLFDDFTKFLKSKNNNLTCADDFCLAKDMLSLHLEDLNNLIQEDEEFLPELELSLAEIVKIKLEENQKIILAKLTKKMDFLEMDFLEGQKILETIFLPKIVKIIENSQIIDCKLKPLYVALLDPEISNNDIIATIKEIKNLGFFKPSNIKYLPTILEDEILPEETPISQLKTQILSDFYSDFFLKIKKCYLKHVDVIDSAKTREDEFIDELKIFEHYLAKQQNQIRENSGKDDFKFFFQSKIFNSSKFLILNSAKKLSKYVELNR